MGLKNTRAFVFWLFHFISGVDETSCLAIEKMSELLLPSEAAKFVCRNAQDVSLSEEGIDSTANQIFELLKNSDQGVAIDRWKLNELNITTRDEKTVDWVFLTAVLNFSFWADDPDKKYTVKYESQSWTGYWAYVAAMNRALDEDIPFTSPAYYKDITEAQLKHILRSDSETEMPLLDKRLQVLHEAGKVLVDKFDGSFVNMVKKADQCAQTLLQLIVTNIPSFDDTALYNNQKVAIYKRVQILIGDLWACFGGEGYGAFKDIDSITMFADYRIPQALVWFGAIKYSDKLMDKLNKKILLENGSKDEVEIRAASIWAVEKIVEKIRELVKEDPDVSNSTIINAIVVDHFMWDYRREHAKETDVIPFHRTRSIYY